MTNQQHPITPPPELVGQWQDESPATQISDHIQYLATRAAQWGADQELEACCDWFITDGWNPDHPANLRAVRRPKPPSLKEQARDALDTYIYGEPNLKDKARTYNTIRAALEALDDRT